VSTVAELSRRAYLLAAIRQHGRPVTTQVAEHLMANSPWPTAGRNTTRKDLRGLARAGHLVPDINAEGRRQYDTTDTGEDGRS
jgi:hypothetical protein